MDTEVIIPSYLEIRNTTNLPTELSTKDGRRETTHSRSNLILVTERLQSNQRNPGIFATRHQEFRGEYTTERATRSFHDLQKHRDRIQDQLGLARGKEVCMHCDTLGESMDRIREVMGPISLEERDFRAGTMGPFSRIKRDRGVDIAIGFDADVPDEQGRVFHRSFHIDYDDQKGYHFNVIIVPDGVRKNSPEALNIAFLFPDLGRDLIRPDVFIAVLARQMEPFLLDEEFMKPPFDPDPFYLDSTVSCLYRLPHNYPDRPVHGRIIE